MLEIGARARRQPPPVSVVFEALTQPHRDPSRPWLELLDDEVAPRVIAAVENSRVEWSSIWVKRPDAVIHYELRSELSGADTLLRWSVMVQEPAPDPRLVGHIRKRMNQLINANLRFSFGQ